MPARADDDRSQPDLFAALAGAVDTARLADAAWPAPGRVPVNHAGSVRAQVWPDLVGSARPLIVAGYASVGMLIDLIADWSDGRRAPDDLLRVVLGTEPYVTEQTTFGDPHRHFGDDLRTHFLRHGLSLERSARIVVARAAVADGLVDARAMVRDPVLHAKLYLGDAAATVGSSNLTVAGLHRQAEANVRFARHDEPERHGELWQVGENLWAAATDWREEFLALLDTLLQVVSWQEALGRACAELLDGSWLEITGAVGTATLWPSQRSGIAQAMWIVEQVGSVLVADATGSGKTKMGAHLLRAVQDRVVSTGRLRNQQLALVCPPAVIPGWDAETEATGVSVDLISHGKLSQTGGDDEEEPLEQRRVRKAQLLAVDEAHNFLNAGARRTQLVRDNGADHVVLFTATPISRGAGDLLDLVALLGPDNFDDHTHAILRRLERRRVVESLTPADVAQLRREIQRFTLRRTKRQINRMVDRDEDAFRHHRTGRVCRYPRHLPRLYPTEETAADEVAAREIRDHTRALDGIAQLPRVITVPVALRARMTDETWWTFQRRSAAGLAAHHVLGGLRSSRAALREHLRGTADATRTYRLSAEAKTTPTGDVIGKLQRLADGPPPEVRLDTAVPTWLLDPQAWRARCEDEIARYERIAAALARIGPAREQAKAARLRALAEDHHRILAFDRHPTTLMVVADELRGTGVEVLIATGRATGDRTAVHAAFAPDVDASSLSGNPVVALCSDAMSEGINLQAASALVHLDLPTTLRVAEQRVGRVDRMDSRHDEIEAWWPKDGPAFATRANERLASRIEESQALLGGNLEVPDLVASTRPDVEVVAGTDDELVDPAALHEETERALDDPGDDLADALEPVRDLVDGPEALVDRATYTRMRHVSVPVHARVSPVVSSSGWLFLAVRSATGDVPRWLWVDGGARPRAHTSLPTITARLRRHLADDPPSCSLDNDATASLGVLLRVAARSELDLLPRRARRAIDQLHACAQHWARDVRAAGDEAAGQRWLALSRLARPEVHEAHADPAEVADRWLRLVAPRLEAHRRATRGRRYALLRDIDVSLRQDPPALADVEVAMSGITLARPLAERVAVCILGVRER